MVFRFFAYFSVYLCSFGTLGRFSLFVLSLTVLCTIQLKLHVCEDALIRKLNLMWLCTVFRSQSRAKVMKLANKWTTLTLHKTWRHLLPRGKNTVLTSHILQISPKNYALAFFYHSQNNCQSIDSFFFAEQKIPTNKYQKSLNCSSRQFQLLSW